MKLTNSRNHCERSRLFQRGLLSALLLVGSALVAGTWLLSSTVTLAGGIVGRGFNPAISQSNPTAAAPLADGKISPANQSFNSDGGTGSVNVTCDAGCLWTATSNDSWITITSKPNGSGNGTVNFSVAANDGASARVGTMTIAGQTFTVSQPGVECTFSLMPTSQTFGPTAGTGSFSVTTTSTCMWTATSNDSWIIITSGAFGIGSGTVNYSVGVNLSANSRMGTVTVVDQTFTVTQRGDHSKATDFDADARADVAVWRPSTGVWFITSSSTGMPTTIGWGVSGDQIVPGDYDADGKTDIAVWRPSTGVWFIVNSSNGSTTTTGWGLSTDVPVPGDYDGDGKTDVAVWRPSSGTWFIINSSNGSITTFVWGVSGDLPAGGDYDGDGKSDIAVWRPSTGVWFIVRSSNGTTTSVGWGVSGDKVAPGDYDGDGKTDVAVWRPSTGVWFVIKSSDGMTTTTGWGVSTDIPVPGDYDGDGKIDVAVWRPSSGTWFIMNSGNGSTTTVVWGVSGDVPVPSAYIRP